MSSQFVALVGAPNSGKTTLYNWLTGSKFKTVNYPGATIEYSLGKLATHWNQGSHLIMDTPGTYSLDPKSEDERVTHEALFNHPTHGAASLVVVVIDGTQISRQLTLVQQLMAAGFPVIGAVTMSDLLKKENQDVDWAHLEEILGIKIVTVEGVLGQGVDLLCQEINQAMQNIKSQPVLSKTSFLGDKQFEVYQKNSLIWSHKIQKNKKILNVFKNTQKIDSFLLHPVGGIFLFLAIMSLLFSSIYWMAQPYMDLIDSGFAFLADAVIKDRENLLWADFLSNGVIKSLGSVLIFLPQIFILFFGIGILESSGYLARAATLVDKPFSKLGLSGRSFVPVLSGFACAVPAIMATRNISSKRDRLITSFMIPLMTCSARLPVYALLTGFLFRKAPVWQAGLFLASLYFGALVLGAISAAILNRIIPQGEKSLFMMELPLYRRPQFKILLLQSWNRSLSYAKKAGPVIFTLAVAVWLGSTFPHYQETNPEIKLSQSYLGQVGQKIEPIFEPMGADWRVGVGLISAFTAREVFVSTLAVVMNIGDTQDEDSLQNSLLDTMDQAKKRNGEKLFTVASVIALIVFFMIALQCMSTFAIAAKETGSMQFALIQLISLNLLAYILAVLIYQGLNAMGVA
jgi:ferrous iron transport protein B